MYIRLKETAFRFEKLGENEVFYFNTDDYSFYTESNMRELIDSGRYYEEDFLSVPVIERDEIALRYIKKMNDKKLYRYFCSIYGSNLFYGEFFHFIEGNRRLLDEWVDYEMSELMDFAEKWCRQSSIKFTSK